MALTLKSQKQIQGEILARLISALGLNDVNPGSVVDVLTQAVAQQDFALYYQIAQVSRLVNLDSLTGDDLDNKAFEYGLTRNQPQKATSSINVFRPVGFVKISTTFYAGSAAPIAGDTHIDVNDASNALISTSGTLILGRGSNNEEEVNYAVAPTNMGTFWRYILSAPLANDHAVEETVILKQGSDQTISAGTIVIVPATGVSAQIQFQTQTDVVLLAGEYELDGVGIIAQTAGSAANISQGAISGTSAFPNPPFAGAQATNPSKISTGADLEADDSLRDRIKNYIQGITRAVKQAILNAIVGVVDPVTAKRVVSANIVLPIDVAGDVKVYIDDGTGFEPSFESRGFETVLSQSTGGEQRLQTDLFPVVKAQIESNAAQPYDMSSGSLTLTYQVGNISETITFQPADFASADIATAGEITALINNRATLIEARTAEIGKYVLITAKADSNENIQVTGGTANAILSFPTDAKSTLNVYIDDVKKSKDGQTATLDSQNSSPYNLTGIGPLPLTLTLVVDGKTANPQTSTINTSDVVNPAAVTVSEIVAVLNRDLAGVMALAIDNNTKVRLVSLTQLSSSSKLHVTGGSLNNSALGLNFSTTEAVGVNGDYVFNRELGIIQLATPLKANQQVTLGSQFTRGKLIASNPELYAPTSGQTLVINVDAGTDQTITFDGTFVAGKPAQDTCNFINAQLVGATALVRTVGGLNYVQIQTNTYDTSGSIQIKSSSTANASFGFTLNTLVSSTPPNKAYLVSGNSGPYNFAQNDSLVVVMDNDIVNSTYSVLMNYLSTVSAAVSTTVFNASALTTIFPTFGQLINYFVSFTSGANTGSGTLSSIASQGSGVFRYTFSTPPSNFASFAVGDLFSAQGFASSENNGYFVITNISPSYVDVVNVNAVITSGEAATGMLSQRRQVTAYNNLTGAVTVGSAFSNAPAASDALIVIPSTVDNMVDYMNNTKITSLSLKAVIEAVAADTKVQISSKQDGSDGYVQVTGGAANNALGFTTVVFRGLAAYSYWTGLLALVHKVIYGDDSDLASYPGYGAAGITFRVLAPTVDDISVTVQLTLAEGVTISSLENDVKSAVTGYINTLGVGDDVIIERIRSAVIAVPGIVDVVVVTPTANVATSDNEVARISDTDVLIG